jgi:membrane fusion protein
MRVKETDTVTIGQEILGVRSARSSSLGAVDELGLASLAAQVAIARKQTALLRASSQQTRTQKLAVLESIDREIRHISDQMGIERERSALMERAEVSTKQLAAEGFISSAQSDVKSQELLTQKSRLIAMQRESETRIASRKSLTAELLAIAVQSELDDDRTQSDLKAAERALGEASIRLETKMSAPATGRVTSVQIAEGQFISTGQQLFIIVPSAAELVGRVLVPSAAMGFLKVGQPVLLKYSAFPYQKFGLQRGTVQRVTLASITSEDKLRVDAPSVDPLYEVTMKLDAQQIPTPKGEAALLSDMQFTADIIAEHRTLLEWLFEPVIAALRR